ncbi:MAG: hypothetical protein RIC57_14915 [Balneola sp.]
MKTSIGLKEKFRQRALLLIALVTILGCHSYTDFEKTPPLEEEFDFTTYWQDEARDSLTVSGIEVEQGLNKPNYYEIRDAETQKRITYPYLFLITDITDSTFITISGNVTFESGLKYLLLPNYSRLMLIEKETLEILLDLKIDEHISNAKVIDDHIYFWYRTDQGYKVAYSLGRVKIN